MPLYITKRQQQRVETIFNEFYKHAILCEHPSFTPMFKAQLNMIRGMLEDSIPFEQAELNFLIFVLDWYFGSMDARQVDPLAEQAYAKLTGMFSEQFNKPWYERIQDLKKEHERIQCLKQAQGG